MRNEILRQLQSEYEQQRMLNGQEEDRRREEAIRRCDGLRDLIDERQQIIYRGVRGILGGTAQAEDLPKRMELLNSRIADCLKKGGLPADYLAPVYRCKLCKDTGYVGEPVKEMCECMRTAYYRQLYREVGLEEDERQTFDNFDLSVFPDKPLPDMPCTQRENMQIIRDMCRDYADRYPKADTQDLLLMGPSGLGKTFLMHAMARRLLDRGMNVLLISAYRFLDTARKAYFGGDSDAMDSLLTTDVLLMDDLGSEPLMENITIVQLFNLINERRSSGKGTVYSTNLNERELRQRYTERIASRLTDKRSCDLLLFRGDDIRRL
jgi:DNA replication protein DnaC